MAGDAAALFHVRTQARENAMTAEELAAIGLTRDSVAALVDAGPCAWVAESRGNVVGFSMIDADDACLFAAFVLPPFEGRGIGRALIERAEAALFERSDRIWLETAAASRAARLYLRLGWKVVGTSGGDVRMEKPRPAVHSPSSSG